MLKNLLGAAAMSVAALGVETAAAAEDLTEINFSLDWAWQGMHGPFLLALDRGYYEEAGLKVTFDRGYGSGDTISKIAAKAYPMGFAEGTSLLKFNSENPDDQVITVLVINDQSPTGVISTAENGVKTPADLMGKKVSATQNAATVLLWPVFAELNGLDPDGIEYLFVEPSLRDSMVIQGQADATFGFSTTTVLNMEQAGLAKEDVTYFTMAQYGLKPYSSSIIVRKDWAAENPETVKGFVAATVKGMIDMFKDPDAGIALLKAQEPLIDVEIETARWYLAEELALLTPSVLENGISVVDRERYETAAKQVAAAFDIAVEPNMDDYFDGSFLPPLADRQIPDVAKARHQ
ncbi:MAG: ABC transporter substrate-binding protein [Paracoccaceae bacterium]|nr:ABC transporter substrate-binding protein [Paracoccaceae bacterium]